MDSSRLDRSTPAPSRRIYMDIKHLLNTPSTGRVVEYLTRPEHNSRCHVAKLVNDLGTSRPTTNKTAQAPNPRRRQESNGLPRPEFVEGSSKDHGGRSAWSFTSLTAPRHEEREREIQYGSNEGGRNEGQTGSRLSGNLQELLKRLYTNLAAGASLAGYDVRYWEGQLAGMVECSDRELRERGQLPSNTEEYRNQPLRHPDCPPHSTHRVSGNLESDQPRDSQESGLQAPSPNLLSSIPSVPVNEQFPTLTAPYHYGQNSSGFLSDSSGDSSSDSSGSSSGPCFSTTLKPARWDEHERPRMADATSSYTHPSNITPIISPPHPPRRTLSRAHSGHGNTATSWYTSPYQSPLRGIVEPTALERRRTLERYMPYCFSRVPTRLKKSPRSRSITRDDSHVSPRHEGLPITHEEAPRPSECQGTSDETRGLHRAPWQGDDEHVGLPLPQESNTRQLSATVKQEPVSPGGIDHLGSPFVYRPPSAYIYVPSPPAREPESLARSTRSQSEASCSGYSADHGSLFSD